MVSAVYVNNETSFDWTCSGTVHCEVITDTSELWKQKAYSIKSRTKTCMAEFSRDDIFPDTARFFATIKLYPLVKHMKGEKGSLNLRLMFDSGVTKSTLHYGVTGTPFGSCSQTCWKEKRETNIARWDAYGRTFNIFYKSYFTGGDSDVIYTIKDAGASAKVKLQDELYEIDEVWENQRGDSLLGAPAFSMKSLLPTDRPAWSTEDGEPMPYLSQIFLPSPKWEWREDWHVDNKLMERMSKDGWIYAFNFGNSWSPEPNSTSYVRRRKWVRKRVLLHEEHKSAKSATDLKKTETNPYEQIKSAKNDRQKLERIKAYCTDNTEKDDFEEMLPKFMMLLDFEYSKMNLLNFLVSTNKKIKNILIDTICFPCDKETL